MADRESNRRRSSEESSRPQPERQRHLTDRRRDSARFSSPPPRRRDSFRYDDKEQKSPHGNQSRRDLEKEDPRYRQGEESGKRRERDKSERDYDRAAPRRSQSPPPRRDRGPEEHTSQNYNRRDRFRDRSPYRRRSRSPPRRRNSDRVREDKDRPRHRRPPDNGNREHEQRTRPRDYSEHRRLPRRSEDQDRDKNKSRARDKDRDRDRDKDRDRDQERPRQSRRSPSASRSPPRHRHHRRRQRSRSAEDKMPAPYKRSTAPLPSQETALAIAEGAEPPVEKQKPNYGRSGKLAAETNTVQGTGVVLKYNEPPEARKPPASADWRLFVFKGTEQLENVHLGERSCWLFGRERAIADFPVDHPSCSKQHAVIQFRYVEKKGEDGIGRKGGVKPYVIDLESANGTKVNGEKIPDRVYYELKSNDILGFGDSTREYVLMLAPKGL